MIGRSVSIGRWQVTLYLWPFTIHRLTAADESDYDFGVHLWWAYRRGTYAPTAPVMRWWWFGPICVRRYLLWGETRALMEERGDHAPPESN